MTSPVATMATVAGLAAAAGTAAIWWLRRRFLVVTVNGRSMVPTFVDGDRVLVRRTGPARIRTGALVVADIIGPPVAPAIPPATLRKDRVVKRVAAVAGDPVPTGVDLPGPRVPPGQLVLLGDNREESSDSRHYGYVPAGRVVGTVLRHLR